MVGGYSFLRPFTQGTSCCSYASSVSSAVASKIFLPTAIELQEMDGNDFPHSLDKNLWARVRVSKKKISIKLV